MGALIDGQWTIEPDHIRGGAFLRKPTSFRERIARRGAGDAKFVAQPGRYHLYVSLACPWAHRTIIVRKLKKLEDAISMTIVHPDMLENGWTFGDDPEPVNGFKYLYQVYQAAAPSYSGRVTVPVLWDKQRQMIVNNESAEIIRMLNSEFDDWGDSSVNLYPATLTSDIDALADPMYEAVNNGVYKAGFATAEAPYQAAVSALFQMLDELELRLSDKRFLLGSTLTEADVRLFTTAVRFDLVYYSHFKCNVRHFWDYPNLFGWLRDVYQLPGIDETVDLAHIKRHYYHSQRWVNPSGIVPVGPTIDLRAPHNRLRLGTNPSA